jgi:predicted nucleic acid-binding protein
VLLDQDRSQEAQDLLSRSGIYDFFISDYSLHSTGIILFRRKRYNVFEQFLNDVIIEIGITVISLHVNDMRSIIKAGQQFNLDFDDAYQYAVADRSDLVIASFDSDFDRTERGRMTPQQILQTKSSDPE